MNTEPSPHPVAGADALHERLLEKDPKWIKRDISTLRATLSMLCNYVWTKQLRPGEHMWSIPVDRDRDFDCILSDAITELEALREAFCEAAARLGRPEPQCIVGKYCERHEQIHGAEAEELRKGIETILAQVDHEGEDAAEELDRALRILLDCVDARDSLAYLDGSAPLVPPSPAQESS